MVDQTQWALLEFSESSTMILAVASSYQAMTSPIAADPFLPTQYGRTMRLTQDKILQSGRFR
jgi:hypothetical protein